MRYQQLGNTGLQISAVGFGGIPIQRITCEEAPALLQAAHEAGINYIDTARAYTVSEQWIGQALEKLGLRDSFILATKARPVTKKEMAAEIETSLSNLRTNFIDLYQIHNPSEADLERAMQAGGALEALQEARDNGKIGHIGITAHSAAVFEKALKLDWVETIMFPYNIVERQGEALIARCRACGKGFIAMKPMAGGALDQGATALRFIFQNPGVDVAIPGMYSVQEVAENAATADRTDPLNPEEQAIVDRFVKELGENFCRRCNYCAPCSVGISIPNVFLFQGYLERYHLEGWAKERYATLKVKAGDCIGCRQCETRCPYHLPIADMMKRAAEQFGE